MQVTSTPSRTPSGAAAAAHVPSSAAIFRPELTAVQPLDRAPAPNAAPGAPSLLSTAATARGLQERAQAQPAATQPVQSVLHAGHAGLLPPVRIPGYQQVPPSTDGIASMASAAEHATPLVDTAAAAWASWPATSGPASFQPRQSGCADTPPSRWSSLPHSVPPEDVWQAQSIQPAVPAAAMSQMMPFGGSLTPEMVVAAQQQWPALAGQLQALAASMRCASSGGGGTCLSGGTAGSAGAAGPTPATMPQHAVHIPQQAAMQAAMAPLSPPAGLEGLHMAGMLVPAPLATASGQAACLPAQQPPPLPPHWGGPLQAHYLGQAAAPGPSTVNTMRGGMPPMMLPPGAMGLGPMGMPMAAAMMGMPHPMTPYFMLPPPMAQAQAQMFAQKHAMLYGAPPHMQLQQQHQHQQQAMASAVAAQQPQHHTQQRRQQQQQQQQQQHQQTTATPANMSCHQNLTRASGGPCMSQCAGSTVTPSAPQNRASRSAQAPAAASLATHEQTKPAAGSTAPTVRQPSPHLPSTWRQLAAQEALRRAPVMRHGPGASFASECKTESASVSAAATKPKASLASGSGCWDTVTQQVLLTSNIFGVQA